MTTFNIGFVIFANITQLDFTGPLEVLSRLSTPASIATPTEFPQSKTHIVAKTALPVLSDRGHPFLPTCTFDDCPSLDLICVPSGPGVVEAIADVGTIDFVRRQASSAKYVTSVCVGAFVLGAAGLLKGRRATTHWAYSDLLPIGRYERRSETRRHGDRAWPETAGRAAQRGGSKDRPSRSGRRFDRDRARSGCCG